MLTVVALAGLGAWIYLLFFHHDFWRADQRLARNLRNPESWPSVTALVPARNEATTIDACVAALAAQDYRGEFRIVVIDDASTDGTGDIARKHTCDVITAPTLEPGWTGKLWALNTGVKQVATEFIWLTDADVVHAPDTLTRLVAKALHDERDLVSLMVKLHCVSFWERLLIPAFVFFFQMLYPFPAANDGRSKIAAAAGGCVLLRRAALERAGGLAAIRGEIIDDCALARIVKSAGGKIWLGLTDDSRSLRAADRLAPLWSMVRRTAFTQLGHSYGALGGTVVGLALVFVAPPLLALSIPWHGLNAATVAGLAAWAGMIRAYAPTLKDYGRSPWQGLLLPLAAVLYALMTLDSGVAHGRHRGGLWKGRYYGSSASGPNLPESSKETIH